MIHKLKSLFGYKEYLIEITWDKGEKEIVRVKAWSKMNAINKVAKEKEYFAHDPHTEITEITILNQSKLFKVKFLKAKSLGIAVRKDKS